MAQENIRDKIDFLITKQTTERALEYILSFLESRGLDNTFCISQMGRLKQLERNRHISVISEERYHTESSRIRLSILEWTNEKIPKETTWNPTEDKVEESSKIDIYDLKSRLIKITEVNGVRLSLVFLDSIVSKLELRYELNDISDEYSTRCCSPWLPRCVHV
ncbi:MAG: hypothetical protein ACPG5P_01100 [Saprospiraceae bacterium]